MITSPGILSDFKSGGLLSADELGLSACPVTSGPDFRTILSFCHNISVFLFFLSYFSTQHRKEGFAVFPSCAVETFLKS
jgi:hypothetical protein